MGVQITIAIVVMAVWAAQALVVGLYCLIQLLRIPGSIDHPAAAIAEPDRFDELQEVRAA